MRDRVAVLHLTIEGRAVTFAAPVPAGVDPMDMTLGQWRSAPVLSAAAMLDRLLDDRSALKEQRE